MRSSLLRVPLLLGALMVTTLTACGDDTSANGSDDASSSASAASEKPGDDPALDVVSISDNFGKAPKVKFDDVLTVDSTAVRTIVDGDGDAVGDGSNVVTRLWVGNGQTKKQVFSSYDEGGQPEVLTVGSEQLIGGLRVGISDQTIGSRVAVAAPPADAFGDQGNPELGIGNADTVLFVIDLLSVIPSEPSGSDKSPAAWAPEVTEEDGVPTALNFADVPKPKKKTRVTTLIEGEGPAVKEGQSIWVNYLGQTYQGEAPFDESYSRGTPFSFMVGAQQVITGWDKGLTGVPVGSRVILSIPPADGYGKDGNEQAGIKGTDTLFFVVDVLGAQ